MTEENYGVLASKCQECVHANSKNDCEGLTKEQFDAAPCGRYKFDSSLVEEEESELEIPVTAQVLGDTPDNIKIMADVARSPDVVKVTKQTSGAVVESPADKFKRVVAKRLTRTQYELKLLAQFGRLHKGYEWTSQQVDEITNILQKGVDTVKMELTKHAS